MDYSYGVLTIEGKDKNNSPFVVSLIWFSKRKRILWLSPLSRSWHHEVMGGNTDYESMTPEMVIAKQNS
jgi:hypothetical protein